MSKTVVITGAGAGLGRTLEDWQAWLTAPLAELRRFDRPLSGAEMVVEATEKLWARR
jgi:short-subunit dehydrogenase